MAEPARKPHRGRLQAQGGLVEESEKWLRDHPLPLSDGLGLLRALEDKLPYAAKKERLETFAMVRLKLEEWAKAGGLHGGAGRYPVKKSFPQPPCGDVRVDVEVHAGVAFVK